MKEEAFKITVRIEQLLTEHVHPLKSCIESAVGIKQMKESLSNCYNEIFKYIDKRLDIKQSKVKVIMTS